MRTVLVAILCAATLPLAAFAQKDSDDFELVARLCGKLERVERIPGKIVPEVYTEKRQPLGDTKLRAYERGYNSNCCDKAPVVAETTSGKSGAFDFKALPLGRYWLAVTVDNRDYKLPVLIQQTKDKQPVCSEMTYVLDDSGTMTLRVGAPNR
jgi:hypothetical protein